MTLLLLVSHWKNLTPPSIKSCITPALIHRQHNRLALKPGKLRNIQWFQWKTQTGGQAHTHARTHAHTHTHECRGRATGTLGLHTPSMELGTNRTKQNQKQQTKKKEENTGGNVEVRILLLQHNTMQLYCQLHKEGFVMLSIFIVRQS